MRLQSVLACTLACAALVGLSGCDFRPRGFTTEVDEERLAALLAEPFLEGGHATVGGNPNTSANATMARGEVYSQAPWGVDGDEDAWLASVQMLADLRDGGWTVTRVECNTGGQYGPFAGATVIALKDLGGYTAAIEASTEIGYSRIEGFVPYHDEPTNPWMPSAELALGTSCLERDEPPTTDSVAGGPSNLSRIFLP